MSICDLSAVVCRRPAQCSGELPGSGDRCVRGVGVHLIGIPAPGKKECFAPSALALAPHLA